MSGMRCERWARLVLLVAVMPLLMGAGGGSPGAFPTGTKVVGVPFNASVVIDPHEPGVTTTGKQATIRIYHGASTAGGIFQIPSIGFPLLSGCDLTLTDARFRFVTLINWIPIDVLNEMFADLGTGRSAAFEPVITRIENDACTNDPANPGPLSGGSVPGILSFQATIRFLVPK
jgi:hypothetical protein